MGEIRNPLTDATNKERMVGGWQCDFCHMSAMQGWSGYEYPKYDDAPTCCHGERMTAYRIVISSADSRREET